MEKAFATRDSILLDEILDAQFICDPLYDPEGAYGSWYCGRTTYLLQLGRLFRDSTVSSLTLDILVNLDVPSTDGTCLDCRQLEATATFRVATPPTDGEPRIFSIDRPMTFLAVRDPKDSQLWVLRKQISHVTATTPAPSNAADWLDCNCLRGVIVN